MEAHILTEHDEVTRDLKKQLISRVESTGSPDSPTRRRSASFDVSTSRPETEFALMAKPGGFRRSFLKEKGIEVDHHPSLVDKIKDFGDELSRFGHDLLDPTLILPNLSEDGDSHHHGDGASTPITVLVLVKTFLTGTLLVIPNGYKSAGLVGGCLVVLIVGFLEVFCMALLVKCRQTMGHGSYGELAACLGPAGPAIITTMVVTSQYGFVCAEQIYVAENALKFLKPYWEWLEQWHLLFGMQFALIPLSWVRKLRFFALTNLAGDVIIIACVAYLFVFGVAKLESDGIADDIENWGSTSGIILFFGNVVYVYEGINMILPIYESQKEKEKFNIVMTVVLAALTALFMIFGIMWYGLYGSDVANVATLNLPAGSAGAIVIPPLYAIACLFTTPVLFFPIAQVVEPRLFPLAKWTNVGARRWSKNAFRCVLMLVSASIAAFGGRQLQNFLALIGGFCCGPLAIFFPAAMHAKICEPSALAKFFDYVIAAAGAVITVSSTYIALNSWH